ncbi:iron-siderophore ABC transporter substrate-binding protein [Marinobacterium sp. AK62]|uniref:Iron-siderophore ABC transporter substrate-binding protein n=1 Tax=Marinobacterium alkalitolerans TaxID=1542925 RepID=A0ABS3ZAT2_9GAMM|nr:iron-siderophore ABC transporter substrate-binding protein [Marinobacterium alkalitolerans]MBP0048759.1 iron-siderophore ABC transporter substrate-binding protein [Marinobacterium alkalitolerans]
MLLNRFKVLLIVLLCCLSLSVRAEIQVNDSRGTQRFETPPKRVVALNWGAAEELIELGVTPVGVADIRGYRDWVVRPAMPEGVTDVGRRDEPSLELLISLEPDLIIIGSQQKGLLEKLEPIAPVLYFDNFRADHNNSAAVEASFIALAQALGKHSEAQSRLRQRDRRLSELAQEVQAHFHGKPPEVAVVRLGNATHARVYGANSMVEAALNSLGLENALPQPVTTWGQVQKKVTDLAAVEKGALLYIEPFPKREQLFSTPLWQFMPFVQNDRIAAVRPVWTYGGALSIQHLAEAITEALLEIQT